MPGPRPSTPPAPYPGPGTVDSPGPQSPPPRSPGPRRPPPPTPGLARPRQLTRSPRPPAPPAVRPTPRNSSSDRRPGPCRGGAGKGASARGLPSDDRPAAQGPPPCPSVGPWVPLARGPAGSRGRGREPCPEGWDWASSVLRSRAAPGGCGRPLCGHVTGGGACGGLRRTAAPLRGLG